MKTKYKFTFVFSNGTSTSLYVQHVGYGNALRQAADLVGSVACPISEYVTSVTVDIV